MRFLAPYLARGPLSHLSVNRGSQPMTNEQRLVAFRACVPVSLRNPFPWPYLQPKALLATLAEYNASIPEGGAFNPTEKDAGGNQMPAVGVELDHVFAGLGSRAAEDEIERRSQAMTDAMKHWMRG